MKRPSLWGRLWPGRALAEMHYRLRSQGDSPAAKALSVGVGTLIGCLPLYGLHLALCIASAKLLRLNQVRTYLAAHINNPISAPLLLYLELGIGRLLTTGSWPRLSRAEVAAAGPDDLWSIGAIGRDLLLGSVVLGVGLGSVLALIAWRVARRWRRPQFDRVLIDEASRRYLEAGALHWEFVRGKLRHDPIYLAMLRQPLLPASGRLLDLGCGRGGALALLTSAAQSGEWPADWPAAPRLELCGIERSPKIAAVASTALGSDADVRTGDLAALDELPRASAILLLDVLHYLGAPAQERLLDRIAAALEPGGVVLIREADADRGWRFRLTRLQERISALLRGHWRQRFHYRGEAAWSDLLSERGLTVEAQPMWSGTPFGNVLLAARKVDDGAAPNGPYPQ